MPGSAAAGGAAVISGKPLTVYTAVDTLPSTGLREVADTVIGSIRVDQTRAYPGRSPSRTDPEGNRL